jgi:mannose-6-phosphate isomerase-like protein (cupin superfamily)
MSSAADEPTRSDPATAGAPLPIDLIPLAQLEKSASEGDDTLAHREWLAGEGYRVGYIRFDAGRRNDRPIVHADQDVLCLVLAGQGLLHQSDDTTEIEPGLLCRIPAGTPHRFAASGGPLELLYTVIQVRERAARAD